jgi:hypothetical protein
MMNKALACTMFLGGVAAVLAAFAFSTPRFTRADAQTQNGACTIANVAGAYGGPASGTAVNGNALGLPAGSFRAIARIVFDGRGGFFVTNESVSVNGLISRNVTEQGFYSVNADCTGSVVAGAGGTDTGDFVWVDNRNEIYGLDTASGVVGGFSLKRISTQ